MCVAENHYFDEMDARCLSCGNVTMRAAWLSCAFALILLATACSAAPLALMSSSRARNKLLNRIKKLRSLWKRAGMRHKLKVTVGLFQCIAAAPSVYNVTAPAGFEGYSR